MTTRRPKRSRTQKQGESEGALNTGGDSVEPGGLGTAPPPPDREVAGDVRKAAADVAKLTSIESAIGGKVTAPGAAALGAKLEAFSRADPIRVALGESLDKLSTSAIGELKTDATKMFTSSLVADAMRLSHDRYDALIDQTQQSASRARDLSLSVRLPVDHQLEVMTDVRAEVSRVAGIVAEMAVSTGALLQVGRDAEDGLIRLVAEAEATREETSRLRAALEDGQTSADTASSRLFWATVALLALTAVIGVLTLVLVVRGV